MKLSLNLFTFSELFLLFVFVCVFTNQTKSATIITNTGGNWSNPATWLSGVVPQAGDVVQMNNTPGIILTVDIANAECGSISIGQFGSAEKVTLNFLNDSSSLTVNGMVIFGFPGLSNGIIDMTNGGMLTCREWIFYDRPSPDLSAFIPGTGKVIFTGKFNLPNHVNADEFNDLELKIAGATADSILTLTRSIVINGNLTLTSGVLDVSTSNWGITIQGNWTNAGGIFMEQSGTVTFNGSGIQTITGAETFYNLTSNTTGSLTLTTSDVTVTNTLNMQAGLYNLNGRTLTLGVVNPFASPSTLIRTASSTTNWMYGGTFKRFWPEATNITSTSGAYYGLFPMGTSSGSNYRPLEINATSLFWQTTDVSNSSFSVNHIDNTGYIDLAPFYNDVGTLIERIHNAQFITAITGGTKNGKYNINVTMTGLPTTGTITDIRLARWTGGTTADAPGTHSPASGTPQNPTAKRTLLTTNASLTGDFRIATINAAVTPLPIKLLSFSARCNEQDGVRISWSTASEINNDFFTLERSKDGVNFESVGMIKGAGNSNIMLNYQYMDLTSNLDPQTSNTLYYRLKQTDFDGQSEYFNTVTVNNCSTTNTSINIYPNPANEQLRIQFSPNNANSELQIWDALGNIVFKKPLTLLRKETNSFYLPVSEFSKGIYLLSITDGIKQQQVKFIKQ